MKATMLVVEDEEKLRRVVELQLKTAGFEVEQAGNAEEGLKLAEDADVILTDLRLPGMSGLDMLQKIREPGFAQAGDRDDGLRQHRDGGGSDEGRALSTFFRSRFRWII